MSKAKDDKQFANGIALGLGSIFPYLNKEIQEEVMGRARRDSGAYANGLGRGLGLVFPYLPKGFQESVLVMSENNNEFGKGLGRGLGIIFPYLSDDFQENLLSRIEVKRKGRKGAPIGSGFSDDHHDFQEDHLRELERKRAAFAYGLGLGLGTIFVYLYWRDEAKTAQQTAQEGLSPHMEEYTSNFFHPQFDYFASYFELSELPKKVLRHAGFSEMFAEGLGTGLGSMFPYMMRGKMSDQEYKEAQASVDKLIKPYKPAVGPGASAASRKLTPEQFDQLAFPVFNLSFKGRGVFVRPFLYTIFGTAREDDSLSYGLGVGIGSVSKYFSQQFLEEVKSHLGSNEPFVRGLQHGMEPAMKRGQHED